MVNLSNLILQHSWRNCFIERCFRVFLMCGEFSSNTILSRKSYFNKLTEMVLFVRDYAFIYN